MADFKQKSLKNSHKIQVNSAFNSPDVNVQLLPATMKITAYNHIVDSEDQ